jgi:hypothetical protein
MPSSLIGLIACRRSFIDDWGHFTRLLLHYFILRKNPLTQAISAHKHVSVDYSTFQQFAAVTL